MASTSQYIYGIYGAKNGLIFVFHAYSYEFLCIRILVFGRLALYLVSIILVAEQQIQQNESFLQGHKSCTFKCICLFRLQQSSPTPVNKMQWKCRTFGPLGSVRQLPVFAVRDLGHPWTAPSSADAHAILRFTLRSLLVH